jgi:hypothetical protein
MVKYYPEGEVDGDCASADVSSTSSEGGVRCDFGLDTSGGDTPERNKGPITVFEGMWRFYYVVGIDGVDGDYDYSIVFESVTNNDFRWRMARYVAADCDNSTHESSWSSEESTAGTYTGTLNLDTSAAWAADDYIVLEIESKSANVHMSQSRLDLAAGNINTWIDDLIIPPSSLTIPIAMHHYKMMMGAN